MCWEAARMRDFRESLTRDALPEEQLCRPRHRGGSVAQRALEGRFNVADADAKMRRQGGQSGWASNISNMRPGFQQWPTRARPGHLVHALAPHGRAVAVVKAGWPA